MHLLFHSVLISLLSKFWIFTSSYTSSWFGQILLFFFSGFRQVATSPDYERATTDSCGGTRDAWKTAFGVPYKFTKFTCRILVESCIFTASLFFEHPQGISRLFLDVQGGNPQHVAYSALGGCVQVCARGMHIVMMHQELLSHHVRVSLASKHVIILQHIPADPSVLKN